VLMLLLQTAYGQDEETRQVADTLQTTQPEEEVYTQDIKISEEEADPEEADELPIDTAIISRLRLIPADTLSLLKKDKGFYYQAYLDSLLRAAQKKGKSKKPAQPLEPPGIGNFTGVFRYLLWAVGIGTLLFVLYKLFLSNQGLFLSNRKNLDISIETDSQEIPPDQYESLIKKASSEGNYRLATRYLYLQSLHRLSEKGYTVIATEKTNYQYLNEIRKKSGAIGNSFGHLTLKYEYIWYGEYEISNTTYFLLEKDFREFNKQL
jgi:hypothetical protein